MTKQLPSGSALVATVLAVTGCSGSRLLLSTANGTTRSATKTTPPAPLAAAASPAANPTFRSPGIAITFSYPAGFNVVRLAASKRLAGNIAQASHAAVGIGVYDLLIVTRFPGRPVRFTLRNIRGLKPQFDAAVSSALGRSMTSSVTAVGGLPALSYPPAPVVALPVAAMSRITDVFVGNDEYELDCQYTPAAAARIKAACDEMLRTLRVGPPPR